MKQMYVFVSSPDSHHLSQINTFSSYTFFSFLFFFFLSVDGTIHMHEAILKKNLMRTFHPV